VRIPRRARILHVQSTRARHRHDKNGRRQADINVSVPFPEPAVANSHLATRSRRTPSRRRLGARTTTSVRPHDAADNIGRVDAGLRLVAAKGITSSVTARPCSQDSVTSLLRGRRRDLDPGRQIARGTPARTAAAKDSWQATASCDRVADPRPILDNGGNHTSACWAATDRHAASVVARPSQGCERQGRHEGWVQYPGSATHSSTRVGHSDEPKGQVERVTPANDKKFETYYANRSWPPSAEVYTQFGPFQGHERQDLVQMLGTGPSMSPMLK